MNKIKRRWLAHYQVYQCVDAAKKILSSMDPKHVYGTVVHSSSKDAVEYYKFIEFLHSKDSDGKKSRTVTEIIEQNLLPEKEISEDLLKEVKLIDREKQGERFKKEEPLFENVRKLKKLLKEKKLKGLDTSKAEELDKKSRQAAMKGNIEEAERLLNEAIKLLEDLK